jgi:hypothetical protein
MVMIGSIGTSGGDVAGRLGPQVQEFGDEREEELQALLLLVKARRRVKRGEDSRGARPESSLHSMT